MPVAITAHALLRYMERVVRIDLSPSRKEAASELGFPGPKWLSDRDFVRWLEPRLPMAAHRADLLAAIVRGHVVDERDGEDLVLMRNGWVAVLTVPGDVAVTVMRYDPPFRPDDP